MLVRKPALPVFDDLSSVLGVETEQQLWQYLRSTGDQAEQRQTFLVVSHRRPVLQRADQIIILEAGRITDIGHLPELLTRSAAMQALWHHPS